MGDITGANAVYMLTIAELFPSPNQLQGFAADDAFMTEELEVGNPVMCLDGQLLGGIVLMPIHQTITLQTDSPSNAMFDGWWQANLQAQTQYLAGGTIAFPSIDQSWSMNNGILVRVTPMPTAKKLLLPRRFTIAWASVSSG